MNSSTAKNLVKYIYIKKLSTGRVYLCEVDLKYIFYIKKLSTGRVYFSEVYLKNIVTVFMC